MKNKINTADTTEAFVLNALENNGMNHFVSGGEIAKKASVSRSAVWKVVNSLRKKGYKIEASTRKGYKLIPKDDVISELNVKKYMHLYANEVSVRAFGKVDSTNTVARGFAENGLPQFTVAVAEEQTNGRGRLGRSFYSPKNSGIYMSIVLRPNLPPEKALYITTAAAAACAEAIESVCCLKTEIKWVNDVLCNNKKVCGILTESSFDTENNLSYVILGIGVNVFPPKDGFPKDVQNASWLVDQPLYETRARLTAEILERFIFYYKDLTNKPFIKSYKKRLCWIGEEINVISLGKKTPATLLGLSENLELEVQYQDGTKGLICSGEVSIRQKNNK